MHSWLSYSVRTIVHDSLKFTSVVALLPRRRSPQPRREFSINKLILVTSQPLLPTHARQVKFMTMTLNGLRFTSRDPAIYPRSGQAGSLTHLSACLSDFCQE